MLPSDEETQDYLESIKILQEKHNNSIISIHNGKVIDQQYAEHLEKIKNTDKKILLFFHMEGCPGCIVFNYLIKYNNDIKNIINTKYELILINGEKTRTKLIQKYNIYSYPCMIIIDSTEKIIKKNIGCDIVGGAEVNLINWLSNE